jgi:hypothetical protein
MERAFWVPAGTFALLRDGKLDSFAFTFALIHWLGADERDYLIVDVQQAASEAASALRAPVHSRNADTNRQDRMQPLRRPC